MKSICMNVKDSLTKCRSNDLLLGMEGRQNQTTKYDVAEHLRIPGEMAAYLEACLEEAKGDAAFVAKALGNNARAKGMTKVARDARVPRENLYKNLPGERSPSFDTILK